MSRGVEGVGKAGLSGCVLPFVCFWHWYLWWCCHHITTTITERQRSAEREREEKRETNGQRKRKHRAIGLNVHTGEEKRERNERRNPTGVYVLLLLLAVLGNQKRNKAEERTITRI